MKRYLALAAVIILSAMLTACSDENSSVETSIADTSEQASAVDNVAETTTDDYCETTDNYTSVSAAETAEPVPESGFRLLADVYGLAGDKITDDDITSVTYDEQAELTEDSWFYATCDGFAYIGGPTGICFNSIDNADIFDEATWTFEGLPQYAPTEYKRLEVGEEICGLTVKSASTQFCTDNVSEETKSIPEIYFRYSSAEFEGSVTMTGYLSIAPEDDYGIEAGDIFFVPAPDSTALPVMNYTFDGSGIYNKLYINGTNDFKWVIEYPTIRAGNIHDSALIFSGIPQDNSYVKVKITVDNIAMSSAVDWLSYVSCRLVSIEVLQ